MSAEMPLRPGELVDITIRAAVTDTGLGRLEVSYPDGDDVHMVELAVTDAVEVVRVAPAEWPPQYGDMWRDDDGALWVKTKDIGHDGRTTFRLECVDRSVRGHCNAADVLARYGPMTLVHREPVYTDGVLVAAMPGGDGAL